MPRKKATNIFEAGKVKVVSSAVATQTKDGKGGEVSGASQSTTLPDWAAEINHDIARKKTKSAVEKAKCIHKQIGTAESEALLVGAYFARIQSMLENGLRLEAQELMALVERRYLSAHDRFKGLRLSLNVQAGKLDTFVSVLNDPALSPEERGHIEDTIKRELTDLSGLARCEALSDDHPLRHGAAAVVKAFEAVTNGPVEEKDIILPEISRRSPLAEWKTLIRAIACFYRRDDKTCTKLLDAIDTESAAARLVPVLRAMMHNEDCPVLKADVSKLIKSVIGDEQTLRESLRKLDQALAKNDRKRLPSLISQAVRVCKKTQPDLLERLKQHISIQCVLLDVPVRKVIAAMGGPSRHDAYFWRLFARAMEVDHNCCEACSLWEEFRRNAVHEGWFKEKDPEAAAIYLYMVDLLKGIPDEPLAMMRKGFDKFPGYGIYYEDQPPEIRAAAPKSTDNLDLYFLYPERLYERAVECQSDSETFKQWLEYVKKKNSRSKTVDDVADRWHKAFPKDSRPLLHLMESAERRNAFSKALKYLEKAEQQDSLNPEVKRARLRLLVSKALRHLKQRRTHLVEKDLAEVAELSLAKEGDRPAFLAALRWACAALGERDTKTSQFFEETCKLMGSKSAGTVVLINVAQVCDIIVKEMPSLGRSDLRAATELVPAVARGCALGDDMGAPFEIPGKWQSHLIKGLSKKDCQIDVVSLQNLTEAALRKNQVELAFAASGVGLRQSGPGKGWFMLLRAQSLSGLSFSRMRACLAGAAELARRQGDMNLLAKVVDFGRGGYRRNRFVFGYRGIDTEDLKIDDKKLAKVIELEEKAKKPPKFSARDYFGEETFDDYDSECQCPVCRHRRGETGPKKRKRNKKRIPDEFLFDGLFDDYEDEDEVEEDFEDDFYNDSAEAPPDMPPEIMDILFELIMRSGGRMPTTRELDRIAREDPEFAARVEQTLATTEAGKYGPPPDFDDDSYSLPEISMPETSRTSRKDRRRKRKKTRQNRKR